MNHAPADYIRAGARLERAPTRTAYAAQLERIRTMLANEPDRDEARRLIDRGRMESRILSHK